MDDKLILVSHRLCPYVQQVVISMTEKGVPFARVTIDLANKPEWFKMISPLGKVPLLRVQRTTSESVIFESAAILEFLEETQPNPLHPAAAIDRARHRAWIEFASATLNAIGRFYSAPTESAFLAEAAALAVLFDRLEAELAQDTVRNGPWFAGERFSLVDAAYGPVFRYFDVFDQIGDFSILKDKPLIQAWRSALAERPSVKNAVAADYLARLHDFLLARKSHLSTLVRRNEQPSPFA